MNMSSILTPERTYFNVSGGSKKRVLENIGHCIAEHYPLLGSDDVFTALLNRERLGSTGLGHGIALPHCRLKHCHTAIGALFLLKEKINFDALDDEPVDIIFTLLVPENATGEHLNTLSMLASRFNKVDYREQLRTASSTEELYQRALCFDTQDQGQAQ